MWFNRKKRDDLWEDRFGPLAIYNGEIGRGLVHTREYVKRMKILQKEYNMKMLKLYKIGLQQLKDIRKGDIGVE